MNDKYQLLGTQINGKKILQDLKAKDRKRSLDEAWGLLTCWDVDYEDCDMAEAMVVCPEGENVHFDPKRINGIRSILRQANKMEEERTREIEEEVERFIESEVKKAGFGSGGWED